MTPRITASTSLVGPLTGPQFTATDNFVDGLMAVVLVIVGVRASPWAFLALFVLVGSRLRQSIGYLRGRLDMVKRSQS